MDYVIGVDFDNTIVSYDELFYNVALEKGWLNPDVRRHKRHVRDTIRQSPQGEIKWQKLQADIYGPRMGEAILIDGVRTFFNLCQYHQVKVSIISHKTEFAKRDATKTNLRLAALTWMRQNAFFEADGWGLSRKDVYFESTRREKIERIRQLRCTHFIDDLEETFLEASFPIDVEKILYAPHRQSSLVSTVKIFNAWPEIANYFFDAKN